MNNRENILNDKDSAIKTTETIISCASQLMDLKLEERSIEVLNKNDVKEIKAMLDSACERLDIIHNEYKLIKK